MDYIIDQQLAEVTEVIKKLLSLSDLPAIEVANPKFDADFALPCFSLAKQLHKKPQEIAEQIATELEHPAIAKAEAQAGFVNLWLSDQTLGQAVQQIMSKGKTFGSQVLLDKQKIVIEVNNPNPFKDMHIGHAYNSIVADTLANVIELSGNEVHRVSYHGDVGVHIGKSMWAILRYIQRDPSKLQEIPADKRAEFLSARYVEGAGFYDDNPEARAEIEEYSKQSFMVDELDDEVFKQVYATCKKWSFDYFHAALKRLNCTLSEREIMEHEADKLGRATVESHIGDIFEHSEGAIIFRGEPYGLHTRVFISSQDTTLYEARDLGLIQLKYAEYKPDKSYIVTAEEQRDYFNVVLKAAELALPDLSGKTINLAHGTVKLSTGKMSSRTGKVINIEWLFEELSGSLKARGAEKEGLQAGLVGALRYAMLKVRIGGDIIFDIEEAISLEGNSGPYLQYAHARGRSILAKLGDSASKVEQQDLTVDEHKLVIKVLEYPTITAKAINELAPHHICTYLYELTQQFNRFYEHNRIIGDERQNVRAGLVRAYCQVLENGLNLLNIPAPDKL
jgi:arginyl-tRNA synthetase